MSRGHMKTRIIEAKAECERCGTSRAWIELMGEHTPMEVAEMCLVAYTKEYSCQHSLEVTINMHKVERE